MRIGIVTSQFADVGGVENVVRSLGKEFSKKHEVCLITRDRDINTKKFDDFFSEVIVLPNSSGYKNYIFSFIKFFKKNKNRFDVLNFHNWSCIFPVLFVRTPKRVLTFHGTNFNMAIENKSFIKAIFYWLIEQICIIISDKVVSITDYHMRPFIMFNKLSLIKNGVDVEIFKPRGDRNKLRKKWSVRDLGIIIVGKHIESKGHQNLFKAVKMLNTKHTLMVAGSGPKTEEFKELALKLKLNANFYGNLSHPDLSELYSAADVFCLPSWNEGLPLSILEALSSGVPVVTSDIADNKKIIDESFGGYVVDYKNVKDICIKLKKANANKSFLSKNARRYSIEKLSWVEIAKQYEKVFDSVKD
jgi:glycosyltransferase involved in cell wall biosynthesis